MEFLPESIDQYATNFTSAESDALSKLNHETWQKMVQPRMLSGHMQGRILSMFSQMIQPTNILEIGTFTGYSAICMAEGLQDGGKLYTIDVNEEFQEIIQRYIDSTGNQTKIELIIGNALEEIKKLDVQFDLVFIDADKENYSNYYKLIFDKVRSGGIIIADNVLWSGKVIEEETDPETQALKDYVKMVHEDERVENVLMPVRDGLMICRKL